MAASVGTPGAIRQPPVVSSYYGQGVSYPPTINAAGRLSLSYGEQTVAESLISILQTAPGERAMNPGYGSRIVEFEPFDMARFIAKFRADVNDYEPRVDQVTIDITPGPGVGEASADIRYVLKGSADQRTLTYPIFVGPQN